MYIVEHSDGRRPNRKVLKSEPLVISVITAGGAAHFFLVTSNDALDISAVLRRRARHKAKPG